MQSGRFGFSFECKGGALLLGKVIVRCLVLALFFECKNNAHRFVVGVFFLTAAGNTWWSLFWSVVQHWSTGKWSMCFYYQKEHSKSRSWDLDRAVAWILQAIGLACMSRPQCNIWSKDCWNLGGRIVQMNIIYSDHSDHLFAEPVDDSLIQLGVKESSVPRTSHFCLRQTLRWTSNRHQYQHLEWITQSTEG